MIRASTLTMASKVPWISGDGPLGCTAVMDPPYETGRPARKWPRRPRLSWPMLRDGGANSSEAQLCVISTSGAPGDVKVILISPCVFCMENHL